MSPTDTAETPKLDKMNKAQLVEFAAGIGLSVDAETTNRAIVAEIEAALAAEPGTLPEADTGAVQDEPTTPSDDESAAPPSQGEEPDAPEPIIKSGPLKVRVRKFFGTYHGSTFMEQDDSYEWGEAVVSKDVLSQLISEFPGAEIEELD